MQEWGAKFGCPTLMQKLAKVVHACNSSSGWAETSRSLELGGARLSQAAELQVH